MSWMVMNIIWISAHSMKIPNAKSMNAREGIAPILNAYVRMKFWISVRWRLTILPHGVMEDEPLLIIARCYAVTATVGKAQDKHFAIRRCSDDTMGVTYKLLNDRELGVFRVGVFATLKTLKMLIINILLVALVAQYR